MSVYYSDAKNSKKIMCSISNRQEINLINTFISLFFSQLLLFTFTLYLDYIEYVYVVVWSRNVKLES